MINKKTDSHFLHNEVCPSCEKKGKDKHKDNLGVFSDGHKFCWSCGYYLPASNMIKAQNLVSVNTPKELYTKYNQLQLDTVPKDIYLKYLSRYGIMLSEVKLFDLGYNEEKELLVFKYQDWSFYNGRYTGNNKEHPKYISHGNKFDTLYIFSQVDTTDEVILVEDYISAIKVSRVTNCLCLFGTHIPLELIIRLSKRFSKIGIWLDMDKAKESLVESSIASTLMKARSIITEKDPKYYSTDELRSIINV